jgi:BioD-like phosphotransacetylase family protein
VSGARRIFLAATGQNRGKTTVSVGLAAGIVQRGHRLGFLKPVGQRYIMVDDVPADEDAVLMREVFGLTDALALMSPVTLPRGFTTDFVMGRIAADLGASVAAAERTLAEDKDVVLIEGTGHAGVGAVVGLSNAQVAALLEAPVIIVSEGGVGRPIDEIVLNQALFQRHGVRILGAVVNKVNVAANPRLPEVLQRGLAQHGVELLGCLPYSELLANPSLELVATHLAGELLAGAATPGQTIGQVAIGAMQADHAVPFLRNRTLLITPGDRDDMLEVTLEANRGAASAERPRRVAGVVLTGGFRPSPSRLAQLRDANLFVLLVEGDTYATAQSVHDILVKTHAGDTEKIETIIDLVAGALDVDGLLDRVG